MQFGADSSCVVTLTLTLPLDLLNPKPIGFDRVSMITIVPSFKSLRSWVFVLSCKHTHPHTHIVTKWSLYRRRRTSSSAQIITPNGMATDGRRGWGLRGASPPPVCLFTGDADNNLFDCVIRAQSLIAVARNRQRRPTDRPPLFCMVRVESSYVLLLHSAHHFAAL